jgi:hypothetical protein
VVVGNVSAKFIPWWHKTTLANFGILKMIKQVMQMNDESTDLNTLDGPGDGRIGKTEHTADVTERSLSSTPRCLSMPSLIFWI